MLLQIIEKRDFMELQKWNEILSPYQQAVDELMVKFRHVQKEYDERGIYCPIENVEGRVKSIHSIMNKAQKKQIAVEMAPSVLEDIAGIRITCRFVEDIYKVSDYIKGRYDMPVSSEVDYVAAPKESGYRSYHLIIQYTVETGFERKILPVEIQIRTMAMNFWAVIEHSLQYKYNENIPYEIRDRLTASAETCLALDNEMAAIRTEIMEAHELFRKKANLVQVIMNQISSLYSRGNQEQVMQLQNEFFVIYNSGNISQMQEFNRKLEAILESAN